MAADEETAEVPPGAIQEGLAVVLPTGQENRKDGKAEVFYNPAQVFNRDLSVLVLSVFGKLRAGEILEKQRKKQEQKGPAADKEVPAGAPPAQAAQPPPAPRGLRVLEALAATGIRSIRYAKELTGRGAEGIRQIVANDLDKTATEHMRRNLRHNSVPDDLVEVTCEDALDHMYIRRRGGPKGQADNAYDVIDLDPYGTCSPFLDAAVQSVADGGLLCITSTDMPVLAGNHPETCYVRYGGTAIKAGYVHEMSLRLVLHAVSAVAARYGRHVQPLLSCSIDFYVRVFVRVHNSPARAKMLATKTAVVHQCVQCEAFAVQPLGEAEVTEKNTKFKPARFVVPGAKCEECGGGTKLGGPFFSGKMHDDDFVLQCLAACDDDERDSLPGVTSWRKVEGMLTAVSEEEELSLFYRLPALCKGLRLPPIPLRQFRGTLIALGYKASHFHRDPEAVKTDAPNAVVYDLMRQWAEEHPSKKPPPLPEILKKGFTLKRPIEWTKSDDEGRAKVARFLPNPAPNWGPKPRARGAQTGGGAADTAAADGAGEAAGGAESRSADSAAAAGAEGAAAAIAGASAAGAEGAAAAIAGASAAGAEAAAATGDAAAAAPKAEVPAAGAA